MGAEGGAEEGPRVSITLLGLKYLLLDRLWRTKDSVVRGGSVGWRGWSCSEGGCALACMVSEERRSACPAGVLNSHLRFDFRPPDVRRGDGLVPRCCCALLPASAARGGRALRRMAAEGGLVLLDECCF